MFLGAESYILSTLILSKIEQLCYIAKSTNVAVIGICESKFGASVWSKTLVLIITKFCVAIEIDMEEVQLAI